MDGKTSASAVASAAEVGPHGRILREFTGRPAEAVAKLRQEQTGEVRAAFHNPRVGDIDLVWGQEGDPARDYANGFGLPKIIAKHASKDPALLQRLPEIVRNGEIVSQSPNRTVLKTASDKSVVRLEFDGTPKNWLLTAYGPE